MDNTNSNQSILDTLRTVEFRLGLKGYNVDEVDEYLEKAAIEAESVQEQLRAAQERLRQATERVSELEMAQQAQAAEAPEGALQAVAVAPQPPLGDDDDGATDDSLQRTLQLAQKFVEQAKRESEAEAAALVARAEERARATISQAEERARQLATEADRRLREEVTRLETMRTHLADEVEAMSKHLEEQRARIRTSLTEALKWIEERVQPAPTRPQAQDRPSGPGPGPRPESQQRSGPPPTERPSVSTPTQVVPAVAPTQVVQPVAPGTSGASEPQAPDRLHASLSDRANAAGSTGALFDTGAPPG